MCRVCEKHLAIKPSALRADNFDAFFRAREEALLDRIEKAMGKPIAREITEIEDLETVEYQEDEAA